MKKDTVDEAIELYVAERMVKGKQLALTHFLACIYLKKPSGEIVETIHRVRGMTRYYIELTKVTQNPLKGPEIAWFASIVNIAIYAGVLISIEEQRLLGIALFSGTLVNACYLIRNAVKKWCDFHVLVAIYEEIIQIADHELEQLAMAGVA